MMSDFRRAESRDEFENMMVTSTNRAKFFLWTFFLFAGMSVAGILFLLIKGPSLYPPYLLTAFGSMATLFVLWPLSRSMRNVRRILPSYINAKGRALRELDGYPVLKFLADHQIERWSAVIGVAMFLGQLGSLYAGYLYSETNTPAKLLLQHKLGRNDFSKISLYHANFSKLKLKGVIFRAATLDVADFSATNVTEADFTETSLNGAIFDKSYLDAANFSLANLLGASFQNAHLNGATFYRSRLDNADFTGADLRGADFLEASVKNALFTGALYDQTTRWPKGFDPGPVGALLKIARNDP